MLMASVGVALHAEWGYVTLSLQDCAFISFSQTDAGIRTPLTAAFDADVLIH